MSKTFEPVAIAKIGGSFKTIKTEVGTFTLPAGTWLINTSAFFARTTAGAAGTIADPRRSSSAATRT